MKRFIASTIILLFTNESFAQYDAECFINAKKDIKLAIENVPRDSVRFQDTLTINNVRRYVDTMIAVRNVDANHMFKRLLVVECRILISSI